MIEFIISDMFCIRNWAMIIRGYHRGGRLWERSENKMKRTGRAVGPIDQPEVPIEKILERD